MVHTFCVALFLGGQMYESRQQAPYIGTLQLERQKAQEEANKFREELRIVKTEYKQYIAQHTDSLGVATKQTVQASINQTTPSNFQLQKEQKYEQLVNVHTEKTGLLFGGNVRISLIGISFEGDPLRHRVTAVIEGFGNSKRIEKVDIGHLVVLKDEKITYEIRIDSVDTFSAQFSGIARLSPQ